MSANSSSSGNSALIEKRRELENVIRKVDSSASIALIKCYKLSKAHWKFKPIVRSADRRRRLSCYLLAVALLTMSYRPLAHYYRTLDQDKCLIESPPLAKQIFRPAQDCSICQDVHGIDRLSQIHPREFEDRYAYSARPVVISDATANWTAMQSFSYEFFKSLYGEREANCQFFPYKTEFRNLREVFNMSESRARLEAGAKAWYVGWSNCDEAIGATLRRHYDRPYFLPDTSESERTDWIFMGSPGYGAPMHVDDVEYPSWQAQIRGRKRWILEPPRECHYSCERLEIVVEPGEIIVLDTNKWYHQTRIVSEDISITIGAEYD
ncbi:hypothetical protein TKK_0015017 [Trichogramma kaykai]|uniref:Cupin-like domain-containing protein n=1 Tax=Trichogramma kaykai TaxID=54128 RepID=A0ABD2WDL5_9HYME